MKIKVCGLTSEEDTIEAARLGAHFIGMIFHPPSSRYVTVEQAKQIVDVSRRFETTPVGVFVDHSLEQICQICRELKLKTIQLHGEKARGHLRALSSEFKVIFTLRVQQNGKIDPRDVSLFESQGRKSDYLLFDSLSPGSGKSFDWSQFTPPSEIPWFLAGGLTPKNVSHALSVLAPDGLDVCSGVEQRPGIKDVLQLKQFIEEARK